MKTKYTYNGITYTSEKALRSAVWQNERKVFGSSLPSGVTVTESQDDGLSLSALKARKRGEIETAYRQWTEKDAVLASSLGFTAPADRTSFMDIRLLLLHGKGAPSYTDSDGNSHSLSQELVRTLSDETASAQVLAMETRTALLAGLDRADTKEAISSIEPAFTPWESPMEEEEED